MKQNKLTISQLAAYAHVTPRTIRYYHEIGLLPEPQRDDSGYRRYIAHDVISLIRIKALTDAGVPLAQIQRVLQATGREFDEAIANIEVNITEDIKELEETKKKLHALKSGEALYLKPEVLNYLNRLRQLGVSEEQVLIERNGWVLLSALMPTEIKAMVEQKSTMLRDERFVHIYKKYDMARNWGSDDPRIETLADEIVNIATDNGARMQNVKADTAVDTIGLQSMMSIYQDDSSPTLKRLNEVIKNRSSR